MIDEFDRTDLDDPVAGLGLEPRGLGVEDDFPHLSSSTMAATAVLAVSSVDVSMM